MKLPRRQFLHLAAGAAALPAVSRIARAQAYPARPVRIVVGYPPGGATDAMARLIAQQLSERFGQQFIVDNRPGPGGNIGTAFNSAEDLSWTIAFDLTDDRHAGPDARVPCRLPRRRRFGS
jgi:tripartite-type tricarboxylate transporter receptor subunit TctC